jgi:3-phosphoshikimate 1-carboxyvinyltransferase
LVRLLCVIVAGMKEGVFREVTQHATRNMPLPNLIEIVPLDKPVRAEITVPGSKSITNRGLILAALAEGEVTLEGALWSEDTQIMVECLQELGFMVDVRPDPNEFCNRTITVYGKGGTVPPGGTEQQPMELFVGNAGTAARFLAAFVCLGKGVYRLHGVPRMHERPQAALFKALRELGYRVEAEQGNDKLPVRIGQKSEVRSEKAEHSCKVSIEESSQFASALLLCARTSGWQVEMVGENAEESPYVTMTLKLIEVFPKRGGKFQIEPDASSGSYFFAAERFVQQPTILDIKGSRASTTERIDTIWVVGWPKSGWQIDSRFPGVVLLTAPLHRGLEQMRGWNRFDEGQFRDLQSLRESYRNRGISRRHDLGDSIMTVIVMAPFALEPIRFTDLGRLRLQECERVVALRTELTKCGAKVVEEGDTLTVYPSKLHGAEIETYNDHRMAMCFAILGLKVPGIKIKNPTCVKKTFPNFFQKLAALPPNGLGATILDAKSGRKLTHEELFAD